MMFIFSEELQDIRVRLPVIKEEKALGIYERKMHIQRKGFLNPSLRSFCRLLQTTGIIVVV